MNVYDLQLLINILNCIESNGGFVFVFAKYNLKTEKKMQYVILLYLFFIIHTFNHILYIYESEYVYVSKYECGYVYTYVHTYTSTLIYISVLTLYLPSTIQKLKKKCMI